MATNNVHNTSSLSMPRSWQCPDWRQRAFVTLAFALVILAFFRDFLIGCVSRWTTEPQYSHGFVIPFMAIGLGWMRRNVVLPGRARCSVWGFSLLVPGVIAHLLGEYLYLDPVNALGFLLVVNGCALLIWGFRLYRGIWPATAFLAFMLPMSFQLERSLSGPLQLLGASEAAYYIQMLGIPAIAQGNTILMGETQLGVEEACSGLRMLMVFMAISVAAAVISPRTRWEKILILISAVPISLICNIARIVATAAAHQWLGQDTANLVFHDLSGWLMIPMGMLLLHLELRAFDWVFVEVDDRTPGMRLSMLVPQQKT